MRRLPVRLPPLAEQNRIVAKIEELFSDLDAGAAVLVRVRANLKRYRAAVLNAAVTGQLTEIWRQEERGSETAELRLSNILADRRKKWEVDQVRRFDAAGKTPPNGWRAKYVEPSGTTESIGSILPTSWTWANLDQLSHFVTSGSRGWAEHYSETGPIFIRAQDINSDRLRLDKIAHVRPPDGAEGARTKVAKNDILITVTGANVTKTAYVEHQLDEAYVSQHVALVRLVDPDLVRYLHYWIICPTAGRAALTKFAYGAGKPGLNLEQVRSLKIALPPIQEQREIVAEVDRRLSAVDAVDAEIGHSLKRAARLRQSILKRAFEGKLVMQVNEASAPPTPPARLSKSTTPQSIAARV